MPAIERRRVINADFSQLHTTASWNMCALLENNRTHASSFVGVGDEVSMIFSNSKDEPWSQYKHLHASGKFENAIEDTRCHRSRVLFKWSDADINHRLAYVEL
jgi:hypothetical protein